MKKKVVQVPMIMQMEALECGAAALAMILAYYKKWVPLEKVRADCGVSRDGSNARNMMCAAKDYGLTAKGYRYEIGELVSRAPLPCILFWGMNHFVVLDGFKGDYAVINDPARGVVNVSMDEFDRYYTGICLEMSPGGDFIPEGRQKSMWRYIARRIEGTRRNFLFLILTGAVTTVIGILNPAFSRVFMDYLILDHDLHWLPFFTVSLIVMAFVLLIVSALDAVNRLKIKGKLAIAANSGFFWHVLRLPMEFFSQRLTGDIVNRQSANEVVSATVIETLAPLLLNFAMLAIYLVVMFTYNAWLALFGVAATLANVFLARKVSKKRVNITRAMVRDTGRLTGISTQGFELIETIKANGAEEGFFAQWSGTQASVNRSQVRGARLNSIWGAVPGFLVQVANISILILGVLLIIDGAFSVGMLLAFQSFMNAFVQPANQIIGAAQTMQEMRTNMERIDDVMNYEADPMVVREERPGARMGKLTGRLEVKGLCFGYSRLDSPILAGFSLDVQPGAQVALVGPSGCGKTTVAKLLSGLYQPWEGQILFDGVPIEKVPRDVLTGSLAVVDQDIVLFEDTVDSNIRMWDSTIPEQDVLAAAKDAQIHDFIARSKMGYSKMVLEGGKNFSGGQRQCIEIARALVQHPSILLMDEATSALDAQTERAVLDAIRAKGITCIIAAHRLSTIRGCDEIIVLSRGRIVERGTHDGLYSAGGVYARLISMN